MMRYQLLLLDTGPIRELVTYRAVHDSRLKHLQGDLSFLWERSEYDRFSLFLSRFPKRATTSSVVAELYRWIRDKPRRLELWELIYDEFKRMSMQEEVVKLLEMQPELVAQCGPADVSLLSLAQRHAVTNPTVLTKDRELWSACRGAKIDAIHVDDGQWK
jgi:rRNA-processing protein FCF1